MVHPRSAERRIQVIATGGRIAAHFDGHSWVDVPGQQLIDELGPLPVTVAVDDIAAGSSASLDIDDMLEIVGNVDRALRDGADGVVVTHGTDTIELTAYLTELMLGPKARRAPVVFTGAMRAHSHTEPDGPQNVLDAITVASSSAALGCEVLVCMDGRVHNASRVTNVNAMSMDSFSSAPFPPLGSFADNSVLFLADTPVRPQAKALVVSVPLLSCYPGMPAASFERAVHGEHGIVLEVFGNLRVPRRLWDPVHRACQAGALVVLASRSFTDVRFDDDLASLGAIGAGGLTPQKARLATMAALGSTRTREEAIRMMMGFAVPFDAGTRAV